LPAESTGSNMPAIKSVIGFGGVVCARLRRWP
jgi:hypothetical protein